jgi:hypothetical protein
MEGKNVSQDLEADLRKLYRLLKISIIQGSPRLFMFGIFNKIDLSTEIFDDKICEEIFAKGGRTTLPVGHNLFRIRKNLTSLTREQFDSAPANSKKPGRFDLGNVQAFYCSDNIDTCVYEARMLAGDLMNPLIFARL